MLIGRGTRRVIAIITLVAVSVLFGVTKLLLPLQQLWSVLGAARWPLAAMAAMLVAGSFYRLLRRAPGPPPAKPRPTHLRLVRTDETLH